MASKIFTGDLKIGMFVADLDRPWVDTPFLLQGFLVENEEQILALKTHCEWVMVDRARSTGAEFEAVAGISPATNTMPGIRRQQIVVVKPGTTVDPNAATPPSPPEAQESPSAKKRSPADPNRVEVVVPAHAKPRGDPIPMEDRTYPGDGVGGRSGLFSRMISGFKGWGRKGGGASPASGPARPIEIPKETPQEFAARAELLPPGIEVQTYVDRVTVEEEVPRAQAAVNSASDLLDKLARDIRIGQSFEIERVEEIVEEMVESVVRNPDAAMWVARLREEDISTYGHGLQVSVYLTAFGRHLGFPKPQLEQLAQIGLLLDIGKIKLPRYLLEKQGRLTAEEYEEAKRHVQHGIDILSATANIDAEIIRGIEEHHERMNGSGYPNGRVGEEIGIYGRMAGIVDTFAALTNHRPYAAAASSYEALRSISGWAGDFFHEPLVQQFVSSIGVFPVGSLIELSTGEVAIVVAHNKVRRLKPRVLVVTGPDKTRSPHPAMLDLLYDHKAGGEDPVYIKRGLPAGAYDLDLKDFYLA